MRECKVLSVCECKGFNFLVPLNGSICDNITAWGAAVWQNNRKTFKWFAGKHGSTSCFRAKSDAFEVTQIWMESNARGEDSVVTLTDYLRLGNRLQSGHERV